MASLLRWHLTASKVQHRSKCSADISKMRCNIVGPLSKRETLFSPHTQEMSLDYAFDKKILAYGVADLLQVHNTCLLLSLTLQVLWRAALTVALACQSWKYSLSDKRAAHCFRLHFGVCRYFSLLLLLIKRGVYVYIVEHGYSHFLVVSTNHSRPPLVAAYFGLLNN